MTEEKDSKKKSSLEWTELILDKGVYFARNFGMAIGEKISKEIQTIVGIAMQTVVMSLLFTAGIIFVLIGFIIWLNELIDISNSIGFFIVGFIILFMVFLGKLLRQK